MEEKNINTAWKVLRVGFGGVLLSAISGPGETEYPPGSWKRRADFKNYGPYALFAMENAAVKLKKELRRDGENAVVFLSEYVPSKDNELWVKDLRSPHQPWLRDVIYADAVKLIRQLT